LALFVSVSARQLLAKLLLPRFSQMHNPVGKGVETLLDQRPHQAVAAQIGTYADRSLTPRGVIGHEVLRVPPIVEQFFGAQRIEQRRNDHCIVTLLDEFTP
jgi:hypothetical protein